ncbi:MAG TPA: HEAT repeat domain-containing protein, partial [Gemmataceae bacterium]|nr:HEAT repeat domain-containing protein [Gemmataceae bacterium]
NSLQPQPGPAPSTAPAQPKAEAVGPIVAEPTQEDTLRAAGLATDDKALLELFRNRANTKPDADMLLALARKLGDPAEEVRAKAIGQLVSWGPAAIPALRHVLNDLDSPLASENAQRCLDWLEGSRRTELPITAARLLASRNAAGTAEALLTYLPYADDHSVVEGVKAALISLASKKGKADPAFLKALQDPVPLRRAVAVEVLCAGGRADVLPEVRKLLGDPKPQVRLRAALALTERQDEHAIGVLIDLLADLPPLQRRLAEDALQQLAGDWAPNPNITADDEVSRKIRRDAWAAWWSNTDGPSLLAAFRKRTLTPEDLANVMSLIDKLGDKSFAVRERASADLAAMGAKIRPLLEQAKQSPDLERSQRAAACLKQIALSDDKNKLPAAAARLLALRKPDGAVAVLLAYLPFNEDEYLKVEIGKAIKSLIISAGKADPVLVKTLSDPLAIRRAAAAEALANTGFVEHFPEVRKLLKDKDMAVRLRVAIALTYAQDKEAVPALIDLAAELPKGQGWEAEEVLFRLAGPKAPQPPTADDKASRNKYRQEWLAWWKDNAATLDLAQLEAMPALLGYTVITEIGDNGNSRVVEVDRAGKIRWKLENIAFPVDVWYLPGNRVLIAECNGNRVSERDLTGKILWQVTNLQSNSVNVQRLANGNTFIAVYTGPIMEVDRAGKTVLSFNVPGGVQAACKTANGNIICLTQNGQCIRMDATGKELKRFALQRTNNWTSGVEVTPKGNILVAQSDNMITEYDPEGKVVWQAKAPSNTSATRLINGHTLVASYNNQTVTELDGNGRVVWEYRAPAGYHPFRARQR